jgi:hypothetical protein
MINVETDDCISINVQSQKKEGEEEDTVVTRKQIPVVGFLNEVPNI